MSFILGPIIAKRVRDSIILNFRRGFSTDTLFPYVENPDGSVDFDCSKVVINDATSEDHMSIPSINVMALSGEESRFIQEDLFNDVDCAGNAVVQRGAPMYFSVLVEATALDVITRDELLDRMYQKFKIVTDDLADNGVAIIKTSLARDKRQFINDRWWYTSGVDMKLYAEWIEEDVITEDQTLRKIKGTITSEAGTLTDVTFET